MGALHLRTSEWLALGFFAYVTLLVAFFPDRPYLHLQPLFVLVAVTLLLCVTAMLGRGAHARTVSMIRDWLPLGLALTAFREMELFVPRTYNGAYEQSWERLDIIVLKDWGVTRVINSLQPILPEYLELCYLLVYGVGVYLVVALWRDGERPKVDDAMSIYLAGTLLAYAFFPFFPSRPPRLVFSDADGPGISTWFKTVNWYLLKRATIHAAVFPSAHVSSAFAAAWAMFLVSPARKRRAWGFLLYAISVSVATVYGRYHYTADVLAGFAVSVAAALFGVARARTHVRRAELRVHADAIEPVQAKSE
jgi:membrane-associated phospholipid phosphatase